MKNIGKVLMLIGWVWLVGIVGHDEIQAMTAGVILSQILTPAAILGAGWILSR